MLVILLCSYLCSLQASCVVSACVYIMDLCSVFSPSFLGLRSPPTLQTFPSQSAVQQGSLKASLTIIGKRIWCTYLQMLSLFPGNLRGKQEIEFIWGYSTSVYYDLCCYGSCTLRNTNLRRGKSISRQLCSQRTSQWAGFCLAGC